MENTFPKSVSYKPFENNQKQLENTGKNSTQKKYKKYKKYK